MSTAFVLSGGASLGAAQVGMLAALADAGIRPDLILGTSVGAINGAWVAGHSDPEGVELLAETWRSVRRNDVFPAHLLVGLLGFVGRRRYLVPATALRSLVARHLQFARLEDAPIPFHAIAVDLLSGADVRLSAGNALDAIVASASIPGVFPPVSIGGRFHIDGGAVNNTPISHAVDLGADTIWVMSAGHACALEEVPRGALAMALHGLDLAVNHRLAVDIERYESVVDLRVVPPLCPMVASPTDFGHSAEFIDRARESTARWLQSAPPSTGQATLVAPHLH